MEIEDRISPSEPVTRFIMEKSYYRPSDRTVRHNAFMPNREGATSVYRIEDLCEIEVYEIGHQYVAQKIGKTLLGHADIIVSDILKQTLEVEPDPIPHPRHANMVGWPDDRSRHRMIALELARDAQLHLL